MKKYTYILLALCLTLSGCGMTDVWKDWENEGKMSDNRLRLSEVKALLCSADGWKMSYEGTDFYLQFDKNGTVTMNTDKTILKSEVVTDYHLNYQGEKIVLLTLAGGGALQYLKANQETTLVITSYSDSQIVATGQANEGKMDLASTTNAVMEANKEQKKDALRKLEGLENMASGALRVNGGDIVAYYSISSDEDNNWTLQTVTIEGGMVVRSDYPVNVNNDDASRGVLTINGLKIGGYDIGTITYSYDNYQETTIDNENLSIDFSAGSEVANVYNGSWSTRVVDRDNICADMKGMLSQVEFDDRTPRHIVVCPGSTGEGQWHYVFFIVNATADNTTGRVLLKSPGTELLFGGYGNDVALVQSNFASFLNCCFSEKGVWMWEKDSYIYVISPTSDHWFRM